MLLIACADGVHDRCDGYRRGDNKPCDCECHRPTNDGA